MWIRQPTGVIIASIVLPPWFPYSMVHLIRHLGLAYFSFGLIRASDHVCRWPFSLSLGFHFPSLAENLFDVVASMRLGLYFVGVMEPTQQPCPCNPASL